MPASHRKPSDLPLQYLPSTPAALSSCAPTALRLSSPRRLLLARLLLASALLLLAFSQRTSVFRLPHLPSARTARMLRHVSCAASCHATGNAPLRLVVDSSFRASLIVGRHAANCTAFGTGALATATAAAALLDAPLAAALLVVHWHAGLSARARALTPAPAFARVPAGAPCVVVGVNDFRQTALVRPTLPCGYVNYVVQPANATEGYFAKVDGFARAVREYGSEQVVVFLDRDAFADVGRLVRSVRAGRMASGRVFDAGKVVPSTNGTSRWKRQSRVLAADLRGAGAAARAAAVDALERWAAWRAWTVRGGTAGVDDEAYTAFNATFSAMLDEADTRAFGRHCSRAFLNRDDCMRGTRAAVVGVGWGRVGRQVLLLAVWLGVLRGTQASGRGGGAAGGAAGRALVAVGCAGCAGASGALLATPDDWTGWYAEGAAPAWPSVANVLVVAVASRVAWLVQEAAWAAGLAARRVRRATAREGAGNAGRRG